jgi:hypothetical protein
MRDPYASTEPSEFHTEGSGATNLGPNDLGMPADPFAQFRGKQPGTTNYAIWIGVAICAIGLGVVVVRELTAPPDPGTVVLSIKPGDARVKVDGKPVTTQVSPYTIQGLTPEVEHQIDVSKDGFKPKTERVHLTEAEVKTLPSMELEAIRVDTGFALDSAPTGAILFIDGQQHASPTPVRLTELAPGTHTLRVELGLTHEPWETQITTTHGQMTELPTVTLVARSPAEVKKLERAAKLQAKKDAAAAKKAAAAMNKTAAPTAAEPPEAEAATP